MPKDSSNVLAYLAIPLVILAIISLVYTATHGSHSSPPEVTCEQAAAAVKMRTSQWCPPSTIAP